MIVRVIRFQSLFSSIGITGWMLRMFCVLKLVLFWKGTLIRLPTGFCASLARSSADISACALRHSSASAADAPALRNGVCMDGFK
ncbi:MAG: hypothetical protein MUF08_07820 [Burkholderiaceae bacterium]|nr:hypothetical protein [Burkholderiaceae bacterium]